MSDPILIATAGHVDHGKSTLIQCLTGTDPDRWAEEKERGITIDLGYAHLTHGGRAYSFVDVPGHERFIHNMLAGVGSIDGVLFIVAADESIMPQTREHALALRYLGVDQVHVVLTKVDLVNEDLMELLHLEVDEWLETCGWRDARKIHFSSKQTETTADVLNLLAAFHKKTPPDREGFRLSIDRVFTSPGSGTVVTGTVDRGSLSREDQVYVQPEGLEARIRQLQVHGVVAEHTGPHTRAALNLGGIHYKSLGRGDCIFKAVRPELAKKVLVRLESFEEDWRPSPKHRFHLHHLAAKMTARMLWREDDFAALALDRAYGFWALDRGLLRDGSPLGVIAGFEVLLPNLIRSKRAHVEPWLEGLPKRGDLVAWQRWRLRHQPGVVDLCSLQAQCGEPLAAQLEKELIALGEHQAVSTPQWRNSHRQFLDGLDACHQVTPFYDHFPLSRLTRFFQDQSWPQSLSDKLLAHGAETGEIELRGDRVKRAGRQPHWPARDTERLRQLLDPMKPDAPILDLKLIDDRKQTADIENFLIWERYFIQLGPELLIRHDFLTRIAQTLHRKFAGEAFTIQDLKTEFQFTRKYAIPLLEYFDKIGCTRRHEQGRLWIAESPPTFSCDWRPPPKTAP